MIALRIASLNTGKQRVPITSLMQRRNVDVLCIQEANVEHIEVDNASHRVLRHPQSNLVIIFPNHFRLCAKYAKEERFLSLHFTSPSITITSLHLPPNSRSSASETLSQITECIMATKADYHLICGDFNTTVNTTAVATLCELTGTEQVPNTTPTCITRMPTHSRASVLDYILSSTAGAQALIVEDITQECKWKIGRSGGHYHQLIMTDVVVEHNAARDVAPIAVRFAAAPPRLRKQFSERVNSTLSSCQPGVTAEEVETQIVSAITQAAVVLPSTTKRHSSGITLSNKTAEQTVVEASTYFAELYQDDEKRPELKMTPLPAHRSARFKNSRNVWPYYSCGNHVCVENEAKETSRRSLPWD